MSPENKINTRENNEQQPSDKEVIQAGKEKGKIIKENITQQSLQKLSQTGKEIVTDITSNQKIEDLTNKIVNNPELEDPKNPNIVQNFIENLKSGNISGALKSVFDFLKGVMGPNDKGDTFWFKDNKEIQDFLSRLSLNIDNLSIQNLESQKEKFIQKIESTSGVKKKLGLTYALSRLLDEIVIKKDPNKKWMKGSSTDISSGKSANALTIARMSQTVKPGDVLAVNKSEQKIGDKLLTQLASDDLDTSHVLIVTHVNPETGEITVAHSTQSKVNGGGSGVETNLSLSDYTKQFSGIAIVALTPPEGTAEVLVKNVLAKDGKAYDNKAAASTALTGKNFTANNDKYNCVELIAQSFPPSISNTWKDWTHPSQMLDTMKPSYVTIAGKSIGGS